MVPRIVDRAVAGMSDEGTAAPVTVQAPLDRRFTRGLLVIGFRTGPENCWGGDTWKKQCTDSGGSREGYSRNRNLPAAQFPRHGHSDAASRLSPVKGARTRHHGPAGDQRPMPREQRVR